MTTSAEDKRRLYDELKPLLDFPTPADGSGRLMSYCPAHGDGTKNKRGPGTVSNPKGRSLSLHPTYGLECFAGCTKGAGFQRVLEMLRARGPRKMEPLPPNRQQAKPRGQPAEKWTDSSTGETVFGIPPRARLVAVYEYRRADKSIAAFKGRWEWQNDDGGPSKTFRWHLPEQGWGSGNLSDKRCKRDDDGELDHVKGCKCLTMATAPLWGSELVSAAPIETPVWICEGEKATQALRSRNELAVCAGWGSTFPGPAAFEVLRGRPVRLWPDNDEPGTEYMAAVRKALQGVAKSVVTVQPPVKPKGDAFDYFLEPGRTIADVLDGVVVPGVIDVKVKSDDHFEVRIPHDEGIGWVIFDFDQLVQMRNSLESELTVSIVAPTVDPAPYSLRINLLSHSAREGLARSLAAQFGKNENWTTAISTAWAKAREAFMEVERGQSVEDLPEPGPEPFLLDDIIPAGVSTVLFGDGSAGKSYTVLGMISAIALGADDFAGHKVRKQSNVLYVDWENGGDGGRSFKRRCRRVWRGMGLEPDIWNAVPLRYWSAIGGSLMSQVEPLRRYIERHNIGLVIIDSAMPACGGSPEDADIAMSFFNALARLRVTSLVISHVSRDSMRDGRIPDRPYGNVAWHNMPRRTWYQRRTTPEGSNSIELAMFCRKINDGAMPPPVGLRLNFDHGGPDSPAWFETWDISESPELEAIGVPAWKRAETVIRKMPMAVATTEDVAEGLGISIAEAYVVLNDRRAKASNNNRGSFRAMGGKERDGAQRWALNARPEDQEPQYDEVS